MKRAKLPTPQRSGGYTDVELRSILGERYEAFSEWMNGQTMMIDDDGKCLTFRCDVEAFIGGLAPLD